MKARVLTSLGIVLSIVLMFVLKVYVSPYFFDVFFAIVAGFAAFEMTKLLSRTSRVNNSILISAFSGVMMLATVLGIYFGLGFGWTILIDLGLILASGIIAYLWSLCTKSRVLKEMRLRGVQTTFNKFSFKKALNTLLGLIYPTFLFLSMLFLNHFDEIGVESIANYGGALSLVILIFAFLIPMFTDSFAMLCGMLFGGKKLAPKISPNKTISGSVGGTVFCILLSACVYLILGAIDYFSVALNTLEIWKLLLIVAAGSVIAQCGDLFESHLKRKAGVKDTGKVLPGHGGMLDRIDSYIFVSPMLFFAFYLVLII